MSLLLESEPKMGGVEALTVAPLQHWQLKFGNISYALRRNLCFTGWMWLLPRFHYSEPKFEPYGILHFETSLLFREQLFKKQKRRNCMTDVQMFSHRWSTVFFCFSVLWSHALRLCVRRVGAYGSEGYCFLHIEGTKTWFCCGAALV